MRRGEERRGEERRGEDRRGEERRVISYKVMRCISVGGRRDYPVSPQLQGEGS